MIIFFAFYASGSKTSLQELWGRYLRGNRKAFDELYHKLFPILFLVARGKLENSETAKDVVSHVFEKLLNYSDGQSIKNISAFMHRSTKNACLDHIKSQKRKGIVEVAPEKASSNLHHSVPRFLEYEDYLYVMKRCLTEPELKIWLLHLEGYANKEIAKITQTPLKTTTNKKSLARQKLRRYLKEAQNF